MDLGRPFLTVTPTMDGDVLAVLAGHDGAFTTGQVRRILSGHSEEGIRKVLRRLAGQGVVLADRVGQTMAYRLNREHLAAEHIIGLAELKQRFLQRVEESLGAWQAPPVYAAVFGSAARGSMSLGSDVDLLLVRPGGVDSDRWEAQVHDFAVEVTKWVGNDVRPLEFSEEELAVRGREEPVLQDVLRDGLTVAGDRAWFARQLRGGNG